MLTNLIRVLRETHLDFNVLNCKKFASMKVKRMKYEERT